MELFHFRRPFKSDIKGHLKYSFSYIAAFDKISTDMARRAVSPQELSFLFHQRCGCS